MEDFKRQLINIGESTLSKGEREMNELLPKSDRDAANLFRGDTYLRRKAIEKVLISNYVKHYQNLLDNGVMDEFLPVMKELHISEEKEDIDKNTDIMFITISPAEKKLSHFDLIKLLNRFCLLKHITNYIYVLEQRFSGIPDDKYKSLGEGIHAHI